MWYVVAAQRHFTDILLQPSVILSIQMLGYLLDLRTHDNLFNLYIHPDDDISVCAIIIQRFTNENYVPQVPLTVIQPHGFYDNLNSNVYRVSGHLNTMPFLFPLSQL